MSLSKILQIFTQERSFAEGIKIERRGENTVLEARIDADNKLIKKLRHLSYTHYEEAEERTDPVYQAEVYEMGFLPVQRSANISGPTYFVSSNALSTITQKGILSARIEYSEDSRVLRLRLKAEGNPKWIRDYSELLLESTNK